MARGMVHLSGYLVLIRAYLIRALARSAAGLRALMTGAFVRSAFVRSAALAGALALAGCYGEEGYQLPSKAMKEISPEMLTLLQKKNMPKRKQISKKTECEDYYE